MNLAFEPSGAAGRATDFRRHIDKDAVLDAMRGRYLALRIERLQIDLAMTELEYIASALKDGALSPGAAAFWMFNTLLADGAASEADGEDLPEPEEWLS